MNANELADELERPNNWQQENNFTTQAAAMLRQQQAEIEALNQRIERMIEKQSHYEAMAHAGGFEAGMKQERALWELAASTQENRMGITFTGGFTTHEAAEEHRQKFMHKDLYTIATVFDAAAGKHIAHFPIPAKAADLIMAFDESAHGIGE